MVQLLGELAALPEELSSILVPKWWLITVTSVPGDQTTSGLMDTRQTGSAQTYIKAKHLDT